MPYVPNASDVTEPLESRTVESAAQEFRTLKARVATLSGGGGGGGGGPVDALYVSYNAGNGTTYADNVERKLRQLVNVDDFEGARDPGAATDDTPVIQAALNYASTVEGRVVFSARSYSISKINITNGVFEVDGAGAKLILQNVPDAGVRMLGTVPAGASDNVVDCTIRNLYIDASAVITPNKAVGIWGQNVTFVRILYNTIVGLTDGHGILLRNYSGPNTGSGSIVHGNRIFGTPASGGDATVFFHGIAVDVDPVYDIGYSDAPSQWKGTFTAPCNSARMAATSTSYNSSNRISNNYVYGAYYGFGGTGLAYSLISDNIFVRVVRGISLQDTCIGNSVSGNTITDCVSAGVHLAYGSADNKIVGNKIYTSYGDSTDSLLNAYVGCPNNTFFDNDVTSTNAIGPKGGMYCGIHSSGCVFKGNRIRGNFARFGLGVESAWVPSTTETLSWAYGADSGLANFANAEMNYVVFQDNVLDITRAGTAAIYIGQHDNVQLRNCRFLTNQVLSNIPAWQLRAYSQNGIAVGHAIIGNLFEQSADTSKFFISTAPGFFYYCRDNTLLNYDRTLMALTRNSSASLATSVNNPVPSVAVGDNYYCANTANTTITDFLGGENGRELTVRLDTYTGIANSTIIKLKGGVSIAAGTVNSDNVIRFLRISNVWFEISRNW